MAELGPFATDRARLAKLGHFRSAPKADMSSLIPAAPTLAKLVELSDTAHGKLKIWSTPLPMRACVCQVASIATANMRTCAKRCSLVADQLLLQRRCEAAQATYSSRRAFLDRLRADVALEPVAVQPNGHDLKSVRPLPFVMSDTPVEVQFTSAGCLNYPCRTP